MDFKNIALKLWPIGLIILLNVVFFGRLFLNREVFYTPGFGTSDLIHQNIPFRQILIDSLKQGKLPLWVSQMGQGFPLFAEGQVGTLNVFNLIPSLIFPLDISLNVTYFLIFSLLAIFTYLYIRRLGLSSWAGLLAALALTFSAKTVVSIHHLNLLLSFSFFTLCLFIVESFLQSQKKRWLIFLAFSFSQFIFAGHPQILFYSALFLMGYIAFRLLVGQNWSDKAFKINLLKIGFGLFLAFGAGILLSLPQLLPTLQLVKESTRVSGNLVFEPYPLRLKDFLMFLRPDFFGNARFGTYPINGNQEGFYWENQMYIGLIPLFLGIFAVLIFLRTLIQKVKSQISKLKTTAQNSKLPKLGSDANFTGVVFFFILAFILCLALALGKVSPLSFVFNLPGFNLFRMPSRFILFADFWLIILAAFGLDYLRSHPPTLKLRWAGLLRNRDITLCKVRPFQIFLGSLVPILLFLITIIDLWSFGFDYNPRIKISDLTTPPDTAKFLQQDKSQFRIVDFGSDMIWNSVFWKKGWEGQNEYYQKFLNSLTPNSNLLYGLSSVGFYAGIVPQRSNFVFDIINKDLGLAADSTVTVTDKMLKLFSLTNTKYFISGFNLKNPELKYLGQTQFDQRFSNYGIWENTKVLPRVYLVSRLIKVKTMDEAKQALYQENFDPSQEAVVEEGSDSPNLIDLEPIGLSDYQVTQFEDHNETLTFRITTAKPGYLYLSDSYDVHWHAFIDGIETKIYPANVNGRLINIEKGEHLIRFEYRLFN